MYFNFKNKINDLPQLLTLDEISNLQLDNNEDYYMSIFQYTDEHKKLVDLNKSVAGIRDVTTNQLVWDFDSKDLEVSKQSALKLANRLVEKYKIDPDTIYTFFSGSKGVHIILPLERTITQPEFKAATFYLANDLEGYDPSVSAPTSMLRIENTKNQKTGLYKIPLHLAELDEMSISEIQELAKNTRDEKLAGFKLQKNTLPKDLFIPMKQTQREETRMVDSDFEYNNPPKGWKKYKWALAQGHFESGERHNALLIIAATCRSLGYDRQATYYLCKSALKKQAERTGSDEFSKEELWNDIVESVFSENWKGGSFSPQNNNWLRTYCEKMGFDVEQNSNGILQLHNIEEEFIDFVKNIDKNTIYTGIHSLDEQLPLTVGMNLGVIGSPSSGKCLGKDTPIRMYDGSVKLVQNIKKGDLLMGDDNTPRKVLSTCKGREMLYKIKQDSGMDYIVNESHILSLKCNFNRKKNGKVQTGGRYKIGRIEDISVKEYLNESSTYKKYFRGFHVGVEYKEKQLPLDPYFLGLWLGDGSNESQRIHKPDTEIFQYLTNYAKSFGYKVTNQNVNSNCPAYSIVNKKGEKNIILEELKNLNLINNKHIPNDILINSRKIRLHFLAGLLDSDGHYELDKGTYDFITKSENISKQITMLCRSLGFKATTRKVKKHCYYKEEKIEGEYYRTYISGVNLVEIPCLIERKKAKSKKFRNDQTINSIKLEKLDIGDYFGFEIDGNHRFLLEDYTVTHNTAMALKILKNTSDAGVISVFASLDMRRNRLFEKLLYRVSGLQRKELYKRIQNNDAGDIFKKVREEYKNVYFYDRSCPTVGDIRRYITAIEEDTGKKVKLVMLDYFERVNADKSDETAASKEVAGQLQDLVNDFNVCMVTLVQPNKFSISSGPDTPLLNYSNIKGSSFLSQSFRSIISIWRPFFNPQWQEHDKFMQMAILKNDLGELGMFNFGWDGRRGEIWELGEEGEEELNNLLAQKEQSQNNTQQQSWD